MLDRHERRAERHHDLLDLLVDLVACVVVPVLANGVRAFATIWAADLTSVEAAAGFDHIVYGWVFFATVMAGVLALGWRWFDRAPDDPAFDPARLAGPVRHRLDLLPAALLTVAAAAAYCRWIDEPIVGWLNKRLFSRPEKAVSARPDPRPVAEPSA